MNTRKLTGLVCLMALLVSLPAYAQDSVRLSLTISLENMTGYSTLQLVGYRPSYTDEDIQLSGQPLLRPGESYTTPALDTHQNTPRPFYTTPAPLDLIFELTPQPNTSGRRIRVRARLQYEMRTVSDERPNEYEIYIPPSVPAQVYPQPPFGSAPLFQFGAGIQNVVHFTGHQVRVAVPITRIIRSAAFTGVVDGLLMSQ